MGDFSANFKEKVHPREWTFSFLHCSGNHHFMVIFSLLLGREDRMTIVCGAGVLA